MSDYKKNHQGSSRNPSEAPDDDLGPLSAIPCEGSVVMPDEDRSIKSELDDEVEIKDLHMEDVPSTSGHTRVSDDPSDARLSAPSTNDLTPTLQRTVKTILESKAFSETQQNLVAFALDITKPETCIFKAYKDVQENSAWFSSRLDLTEDKWLHDEGSIAVFALETIGGNENAVLLKRIPLDHRPDEAAIRPSALAIAAHKAVLTMLCSDKGLLPKELSPPFDAQLVLAILTVAQEYDCLKKVREVLSSKNYFYKMHDLEGRITHDPPCWVMIAFRMHDKRMFKESAIHIIGTLPEWDWPTSQGTVQKDVLDLLKAKARTLTMLKHDTHTSLFLNKLTKADKISKGKGEKIVTAITMDTEPKAWLVAVRYSEWFKKQLARHRSDRGLHSDVVKVYRAIVLDTDPAVKLQSMIDALKSWHVPQEMVIPCLEHVKSAAREIVEPLLHSELHFAGKHDLPYVTCTDFLENEYPWTVVDAEDTKMEEEYE